MISFIKSVLKIDAPDKIYDKDSDEDINNYKTLVNSSKYADSNANTDALEKLVKAMTIGEKSENASKSYIDVRLDTTSDNATSQSWSNHSAKENRSSDHKVYDERKEFRFVDRLQAHLRLLEELQGEEASVLPAQPCYQPDRFGKVGGRNFVLMRFEVPRWVYEAMETNNISLLRLNSRLHIDNYIHRFQTLLWVEEAHQAIEMRRYDQYNELLAKHSDDFFLLEVPGLAEGRPSLMRGDRLILKSEKRASHYEGYIYEVRERDVVIKLHASLHSTAMDGLRFDVSFMNSRTPYRRCHHGIVQFRKDQNLLMDIAFPTAVHSDHLSKPMIDLKESSVDELRCFMSCLNDYQRRAVINVLKGECRPAPYIIFGPPGTGKTVTVVEAVLQVYARKKNSKILVCGNSNSCVDLIAQRIQDSNVVPKKEMIRVSAFYRMEKLIPVELEEITRDMDTIDTETYAKCRVIITTCIQSGALYEFKDLFDYVFIDEAGHANEPEALISIGLVKSSGCVVLAGDPHQLGPVCVSPVASSNGLGTSLLERLTRRSIYQRQVRDAKLAYDPRYITKLIICYRSDKRVMVCNNELFYHNELKFENETPQFWLDLLKVEQPLVFHNVKGRDRREYVNPSWFNPSEAITCLSYVSRLYKAGLRPDQLGIITPYRRQIEKMNLLFDSCSLKRCKTATMEEFQGDEREVIIISTVRTRERNINFDKQFNLGFLFNPKRFNVAISRAKWLVIVVGDKQILSRDSCWLKYIEKAHRIEDSSTSMKNENGETT